MRRSITKTDKPLKVNVRGGFSDRMKIKPVNTQMQNDSLDERTRTALINAINLSFNYTFKEVATHSYYSYDNNPTQNFIKDIMANVYQLAIDYNTGVSYREDWFFETVNETIFNDDYDDVLTVVEYVVSAFNRALKGMPHENLYTYFNNVFEKEYVGYRFVGGHIVAITSEEEINELEMALKQPFDNVNKHLRKALEKISDRTAPDYENSIKESISAVEAMCEIILGEKGTLGDALKKIDKNKVAPIHPALKEAFLKLYGYTSDSKSGIRHAATIGGPSSTFAEARYMLVTCAAFTNYLKTIMSEESGK